MEEERPPDTQQFHNPGWGLKVQGGSFPPWLKPQITLIFSQAFPWLTGTWQSVWWVQTQHLNWNCLYICQERHQYLFLPKSMCSVRWSPELIAFGWVAFCLQHFNPQFFISGLFVHPSFFAFHHEEEKRHHAIWMCSASQQHRLIINRNKKNV